MPRFALLLLLPVAALAADAPPKPAQVGMCAACHGEDGRSRVPDAPHLAGQVEAYLAAALRAYRDGQREHAVMRTMAGTLSDDDVAALARWYAAQPAGGP